jgi:hypothetical protein
VSKHPSYVAQFLYVALYYGDREVLIAASARKSFLGDNHDLGTASDNLPCSARLIELLDGGDNNMAEDPLFQ